MDGRRGGAAAWIHGLIGKDQMPTGRTVMLLLAPVVALLIAFAPTTDAQGKPTPVSSIIPGQYIVVFNDSVDRPGEVARAQVKKHDGDLGFVYTPVLKGYLVTNLSKADAEALRKDPRVKEVEPDQRATTAAQTTPTGIKRIFALENPALDIDGTNDAPIDVDIAILDSGVDDEHPDLDVVSSIYCDVAKSAKCVGDTEGPETAHGTHVAGIAAAIDNGEGVVGVAPGARLWSVKVLDATGSFGDVIAGIQWVTEHADEIEVANMSIGCAGGLPCFPAGVGEAISASAEAGIVYVAAAGNNAGNASESVFGTNPDVITVSGLADYDGIPGGKGNPNVVEEKTCASGADDTSYPWSNYGSAIEVAAPGVCILSTASGGGYQQLTGTSMASPHVAGAAAILASRENPEDGEDVEAIGQQIEEAGNFEWTDTSKDGVQEPLLDVASGEFLVSAPTATTLVAFNNMAYEATLRGSIDPNGGATKYHFEYDTAAYKEGEKAHGTSVPVPDAESGFYKGVVSYVAKGLNPATTYHYRLVATNSAGTSYGADETVKTLPGPTATTTAANELTSKGATLRGTVNPNGLETTYRFEYGTTTSYGTSVPVPDKGIGSGASPVEVSNPISGLLAETTYHYRIMAENSAGTIYGADQSFTTLAITPSYMSSFGSEGSGPGQFQWPTGLVRDVGGNLWVSDFSLGRIQKFDEKGEYLSQVGSPGSGNGQLDGPLQMAFTSSGDLWVSDSNNDRLQKFNSKGEYVAKFGSFGSGNGQFDFPWGIAIAANGNIWVTDFYNDRLQEFTAAGVFVREVHGAGYGGSGNGEFSEPTGIAIDSSGNIWVSDGGNQRVQKLSSTGTYLAKFGSKGTGDGQFEGPGGVTIKPSGNLFVTDFWNHRVQQFSPDGEFLGKFGGEGAMGWPYTVALGPGGTMFVVNPGYREVQKWQQPTAPEATTQAATAVKANEATLNGTVNPSGASTTYRFEYGKTTAYGTSVPEPSESVGSGAEPVAKSKTISGLSSGVTYHYRIVAENSEGTTFGKDETFVPASAPR